MNLRFLPDEPIQDGLEDVLGFKDFTELIHRSIKSTETPFVYGVLGDWGTGKTSVLNLLKSRMNDELSKGAAAFVPVWFNAWQYENEENMIYPVLYAIKQDYDKRITLADQARGFGKTFLRAASTSALALTDLGLRAASKALTGEALSLESVQKNLDVFNDSPKHWDTLLTDWAGSVAGLRDAFDELLQTYATDLARQDPRFKAADVRFVILIDDLDRCLPDNTIAILESIKNFLNVHNCIFVLGLNARVVYQGIHHKYQGISVDGREYLEKILNYTFFVPEPALRQVSKFVDDWIRRVSGGAAAGLPQHLAIFGSVLEECRFNNPRRIKRIANRFLLFLSEHEPELDKYFLPNIVRLITLAEYFPALFRLLLAEPQPVIEDLQKTSQGTLTPREFESKFGVSIVELMPQIKIMRKLFDLQPQADRNKPDLNAQVQQVFRITRTV